MSTSDWAARANALRHDDAPPPQYPTRSEVRVGGSGAGLQFVVVHSIPSDDSFWINVRRVEPNDSDPWDGGMQFAGDVTPMNCWPMARGRHYSRWVYDGDDPAWPMLRPQLAVFVAGAWWVMPTYRFRYTDVVSPARVTDCYPSGNL